MRYEDAIVLGGWRDDLKEMARILGIAASKAVYVDGRHGDADFGQHLWCSVCGSEYESGSPVNEAHKAECWVPWAVAYSQAYPKDWTGTKSAWVNETEPGSSGVESK